MRITQVVLSLGAGGTERLVIDLCKALHDEHNVRVLCLDALGVWANELTAAGIEVTLLGRRPGFDWGLVGKVAARLREHGAEVVHCHHYTPYIYGGLGALIGPRSKVVYTEHGRLTDAPWTVKRKLANAVFGRLPGRFFAVSTNLREHMVEGGMPDRRVEVIYNGIDPGDPPSDHDREVARERMGCPDNAFVFGTVARLDPVKDLPSLLEAYAAVRGRFPRTALVVVGEGDERARLERLADELGLGEDVRFLGHRDDARELLAGFDVYVNCSTTEGVSVTILEAMAARLPVVVTAVGGTPEVVAHENTGLMIPARAPEVLALALERLLDEPSLRTRLGHAARAHVEAHFATSTMLNNYLDVYGAPGPRV